MFLKYDDNNVDYKGDKSKKRATFLDNEFPESSFIKLLVLREKYGKQARQYHKPTNLLAI